MAEKLQKLAALLDADLIGDADVSITGVAGLETARAGDIVFAENKAALKQANDSPAAAIIVGKGVNGSTKPVLCTDNPRYAFSCVVNLFNPEKYPTPGVHKTAVLSESVELGKDVHIGPNAVIDDRVKIGDNSIIGAGVYVGDSVELGKDCRIRPNVSIYHGCVIRDRVNIHSGTVIGGDGFGYVKHKGKQEKLLQLGNVVIEDDVEIGCNCCIDRASFGSTRIGRGTKIDNLIQIGHNVEIGHDCIIVSQVGISGSTKIGRECTLAGQVGIANHAVIEDRVIIGAQSGVPSGKRVRGDQTLLGSPVRKVAEAKRQLAAVALLPKYAKNISKLASEVEELRQQLEALKKQA